MIRILDKSIADKIAAGEVIDRPVSIIKELLENSLDAEASSITVEIKNGGKSYIRVTDNGCGIGSDEVELAFMRHATSKISSEGDLDAINTLGFRGEALASICAVSRVELITKTASSKTGRKAVIEGSDLIENVPTGCPDGTTVTVRDLFYNLPARKKFLSSDSSEARRIIDMVSRIALSYGDVRINMISNGKSVFSTRGNGNILNNIISIYGSDIGRHLLPLEAAEGGFLLKGFVSSPAASAPSRSKQVFCVNGRIVSSKVLEKALEDGYREKLFHGRFPIAFLFLSMPPEKLDVNVHPTKKEIRFDDDFQVEDFVRAAVKRALNVKEALPQIKHENILKETAADKNTSQYNTEADTPVFHEEKNMYFPASKAEENEQVDIKSLLSDLRQKKEQEESEADIISQGLIPDAPRQRPFDFKDLEYIGVIFRTYILAADYDCFYLIDQHAAHERIFYEKLLEEYNSKDKPSQQLLLPLSFNASAGAVSAEASWINEISELGYKVEFFGNNTYIVREVPAFMELSEAEAFLEDFFIALDDRPDLTDKRVLEKIIMRSCRSAVKGGDMLSEDEIQYLMRDLADCINPFSCPHGRPTFIRMTKYEIEKLFKRV